MLTSLEVSKEVLLIQGFPREKINHKLAQFVQHDRQTLKKQYDHRNDESKMVSLTIQAAEELDLILSEDKVLKEKTQEPAVPAS